MGQFVNLKITAQELAEHGMTSLPGTQWKNQAEMLKAKLDEDGTFVAGRLGQILDLLELSIAAASIGADVPSVATKTVQGVLSAFEAAIASRYTKTEADTLISGNTNNLMESLAFNDQTGVFTITKKDGTVSTIDTVLEKVPVSMSFETVGDVTRIKLTNQDGSTSYADVSSLVDNYTFQNTPTVAFNITGVGNKRVLEAYVRDHSITLTHLDLAAVTELQNYVASASNAATAAANSATAASTSEANALASKQDAAASAANAATSASNAAISASNAEASKNAAASSETAAFNSKNAAATSATNSQSWAVGGTGTRVGEDANNAKYWSDRAAAIAGQKVATFNGREGVVVPMAGDYTPEMVGATPSGHGTDETKHVGVLAKTSPADTDSVALVDSADGDKLKRISWANIKGILGQIFAPITHKNRHASGGADALTPADIGAAPASNGIPYVPSTGSANAYVVTVVGASTYTEGMALAVKINISNTGASTINVNGLGAKVIKDSKGQDLKAGTLTANSIYTLRYNGTNFILQGEGSDLSVGLTATAANILSGKTAAVNGEIVSGSMTNRGSPSFAPGTANQSIPAGYYSGGTVNGDADLIAANIKSGVNIFGVAGTLNPGVQFISGSFTYSSYGPYKGHTVTGLPFMPSTVLILNNTLPVGCNYTLLYGSTSYAILWNDPPYNKVNGVISPTSDGFTIKQSDGYTDVYLYGTYEWYAFK